MDEQDNPKEAEEFLVRFGERVRRLRRLKGLSQEEMGFRCGVSQTYFSQIERGIRNISLDTTRLIAKAMEINLAELVHGLDAIE